jgi:cellulose synthase/poly-beta-1,6-N-acetylglucosamine synthase-like glycosyltransferase
VETVGHTALVFVFCDSDVRFPRTWLRNLTGPLSDPNVGVSTGYRWYVADRFHFSTLLRSAWNATVVGMLGDHPRNFAWGGSMALRRETFDRIGVLEAWRGAVSDDYAVTRAAERARARIWFVPDCLVPSLGTCGFRELLEFTTRQIIITRVYHPRLWRLGLFAQTVFNVSFVALATASISQPLLILPWLLIYGLSAAKSAIRLSAVRAVLRDPSLSRYGWFYILSSPIVALLYQYNMVLSALTTEIEWRQIHYTLISANETRVRRSSASAN